MVPQIVWCMHTCVYVCTSMHMGSEAIEHRVSHSSAATLFSERVLLRVTIAVMTHRDQSSVGRKGFIQLTLLHYSLLLKEVRSGTQTQQEPGGQN